MVLTLVWTVVALVFSSCDGPKLVDQDTGEISGEKVYKNYCISCHGPKGDRGLADAADLTQSNLSDAATRNAILKGGNGMAAYENIIEEEAQIDALIDYIKTFRKN